MSKAKSPVTPNGNPRVGGVLEVKLDGGEEWEQATIQAVLDMVPRPGVRGVPFKAVILRGEKDGQIWQTNPERWDAIDWRHVQ